MSHSKPWILAVALALSLSACIDSPEPLVIGHRGSPLQAVENSVESFRLAYLEGAAGVEFDVQYTKDSRAVVMHDETLDRTTTCTGAVRDRTLADLAGCKLSNGEPIRLLENLLPDLARWFSIIFLEIKVPEERPLPDSEKVAYTDEVARVVKASGLSSKIVIISYDRVVLEHLAHQQAQGIIAGWDSLDDSSVGWARRWQMPWSLMPASQANETNGAIARGLGQNVAVYQVETPHQLDQAAYAKVTAIMADSIPAIHAMLDR